MRTVAQIGEFGLIALLKRRERFKTVSRGGSVIAGIGDDAAAVAWDGRKHLLLATDMLLDGIHFTMKDAPEEIGHKALGVNLSDIAAMGGIPRYALISLGIPASIPVKTIQGIYRGMETLGRRFGVAIVGGDTNRAEQMTINVALTGEVAKRQLILRKGARPGDAILVTGPLGNSYKTRHHLKFMPRLQEASILVRNFRPSAMIDISDGLSADLQHILEASGVGAKLYEQGIPCRGGCSLERALYDGEDFELLFTLGKADAKRLMKAQPFPVYFIGEVTGRKNSLELVKRDGKAVRLVSKGYRHF